MGVRSTPRWKTRLGRWIADYGAPRLAGALSRAEHPTTTKAVHEWLAGRSSPTLERAVEISRISRGKVSVEDIHRHRERLREGLARGLGD